MRKITFLMYLLVSFSLTACANLTNYHSNADEIAREGNFQSDFINSNGFKLKVISKGLNKGDNLLVVYIEGDGFAWKKKHIQSSDPTPRNPIALKMAAQDPGPSVLYIARPCQYLDANEIADCHPKYWSTHRYADEVIEAINQLINQFKHTSIALIGYSGGGTIASLITARRTDVVLLVTVAANLDHEKWTGLHDISPLEGSLNAADFSDKTSKVPQIHFIGEIDEVVPESIVDSYISRQNDSFNTSKKVIKDFNHRCCWAETWSEIRHGIWKELM